MAFQSHSRPVNPYIGNNYATFISIIAGLVTILVIFEQLGINSMWLGHVVMAAPVFAYVIIGFATRTVVVDEFFVSGRRVPAFYNGLGFAGAGFGGIGFFALTGALFMIGFDALAIGLGMVAGLVLMAVLIVPYLRKHGAYTLPSFLGDRFSSPSIRLLAALLLLPPSMMLMAAELRIAAEVISQFTATSFSLLVALCAAVVLLSSILGGMRSLTWTTGAQMLVVLMGLMTPLVILAVTHTTLPLPQITYGSLFSDIAGFEQTGGLVETAPKSLDKALPGENTLVAAKPTLQLFGAIKQVDFLFLMISVMLGAAVLPASLMRIGAAPSVTMARRSIGWGVVLMSLLLMTVPAVAAFAKYLLYDGIVGQPLNAMPNWFGDLTGAGMIEVLDINKDGLLGLRELAVLRDGVPLILPIAGGLPFVLVGFMAAAGIAAALAAAGAQMVVMSASISEDIFHGALWRRVSKAKQLLIARLSMIALIIIAALVAVQEEFDILHMGLWALSLTASSFFAPVVLSIWWKGMTTKGALASMLAGTSVAFSIILLHWLGVSNSFLGIESLTAAIAGVPVGIAAAVGVSMAWPNNNEQQNEMLDEIRVPDGETLHDYETRLISGRGF